MSEYMNEEVKDVVETEEGTLETTYTPNGVIEESAETEAPEPKAIFLIDKNSFLKGAAAGGAAMLVGKTLVDKTVAAVKKKLGERGPVKKLKLQKFWRWEEVEEKKPAEPAKNPENEVQNNSTPAAEKNNS